MNQKLINKAQELRAYGFTTGEIADELNVSLDTARWLILQKTEEIVKEEAPVDFYIDWKSLSESSSRLRYASMALSDMAIAYGDIDAVVGIATSGVPFATMMADFLEDLGEVSTSLSIFHPSKHREELGDSEGSISTNFGTVKGKKVAIVDDVITSGTTIKDVISTIRDLGGEPVVITVLIDKSGLSEIDGVPVESLIKVSRLN